MTRTKAHQHRHLLVEDALAKHGSRTIRPLELAGLLGLDIQQALSIARAHGATTRRNDRGEPTWTFPSKPPSGKQYTPQMKARNEHRILKRKAVYEIPCSECPSQPGQGCRDENGASRPPHFSRRADAMTPKKAVSA